MYGLYQYQVALRLGEAQLSAVGLGDDHQWNCSLNGGGVDAETEVLVVVCFATVSAPAFFAPQLPLLHSSEFGLWDDIIEHQCYEQIRDTTAL